MKSWVIWFADSRYAYAWGATAEEARESYLREWAAGIVRVAPAGEHKDQLPPSMYVPPVSERQ